MTKIARWFVAVGLVSALVLVGCGAPASPEPSKPVTPTPSEKPTATPTTLTREQQLFEAAKKEGGEVTLWVHTISDQDSLIKLFQARYPGLTLKIWNSQGAEIMARLKEETKAGRHSVDVLILSSEMEDARTSGLLAEYDYPNVAGWTNQPKHKLYKALGGTSRVIAYNTNVIAPADVPKTYDDLKSTKWAGKVFMSTSGEDTPLFWAWLWRDGDKLNWDKSFAFWGEMIKNTKPMVASGFTGPLSRLAAGEMAIMAPTSTPSFIRLLSVGAPLAALQLAGGASGDYISIGLAKDGPHPNSGKLLIDWLTGPEGLLAYCNPTQYLVLDPKLVDKSATAGMFKKLGIVWDPLPMDTATSENLKKSSEFWMKALGR